MCIRDRPNHDEIMARINDWREKYESLDGQIRRQKKMSKGATTTVSYTHLDVYKRQSYARVVSTPGNGRLLWVRDVVLLGIYIYIIVTRSRCV